jgi:hypothetical protein
MNTNYAILNFNLWEKYMLNRDTHREIVRRDFSVQFMADFVRGNTNCQYDPYNRIGYNCGVNPPRVYQRWGDYHQGVMQNV